MRSYLTHKNPKIVWNFQIGLSGQIDFASNSSNALPENAQINDEWAIVT